MVGSRTATALLGLAFSLAISVAAYVYFDTLLLFLVVPFVPFLLRRSSGRGTESPGPPLRHCPECGFATRDPEAHYCPRDGTALETDA